VLECNLIILYLAWCTYTARPDSSLCHLFYYCDQSQIFISWSMQHVVTHTAGDFLNELEQRLTGYRWFCSECVWYHRKLACHCLHLRVTPSSHELRQSTKSCITLQHSGVSYLLLISMSYFLISSAASALSLISSHLCSMQATWSLPIYICPVCVRACVWWADSSLCFCLAYVVGCVCDWRGDWCMAGL